MNMVINLNNCHLCRRVLYDITRYKSLTNLVCSRVKSTANLTLVERIYGDEITK